MLMDATGEPVTAVGDQFVMHTDRDSLNDRPLGRYDVTIAIATAGSSTKPMRRYPACDATSTPPSMTMVRSSTCRWSGGCP